MPSLTAPVPPIITKFADPPRDLRYCFWLSFRLCFVRSTGLPAAAAERLSAKLFPLATRISLPFSPASLRISRFVAYLSDPQSLFTLYPVSPDTAASGTTADPPSM